MEVPRLIRNMRDSSTAEETTILPQAGETLRIGRVPGDKHMLQLNDPARPGQPISNICPLTHRVHASIINRQGQYWITALGNRMLTHVNDDRMRPHDTRNAVDDSRQLLHGDNIRFGGQALNEPEYDVF